MSRTMRVSGAVETFCPSSQAYLSYIRTCLSYLCEELDSRHPFIEAQACFAGEVVQMRYQALHDVF